MARQTCEYCGRSEGYWYDDYLEVYRCNYCNGQRQSSQDSKTVEELIDRYYRCGYSFAK